MTQYIRGAGSGPKPPPAPTRAPDTLNSRQTVTLQELLSEGEIEGSATASKEGRTQGTVAYNNAFLKDVYLNDTPILQSSANSASPLDSDFNFQDVTFTPRFGTGNQGHISGVEQSSSVISGFPQACTVANGGVVKEITNSNVDAIRITINFAQLQKAEDNGDLLGSSVELKVQTKYNGDTDYGDVFSDTITGRTGDSYSKDYRLNLTGSFPVFVKVVRVTADAPPSGTLRDEFSVLAMQELIDDKQTYVNSAYVALGLDSKIFSSIPTRKYRIRGVKIRIPGAGASNSGTPTIDNNTGRIIYPSGYIFNGTMQAAKWCSCPAMVLLDLLTTERYGLGTFLSDTNLDLFSFVAASKYANEEVNDGFGGLEARFSCNVNIVGQREAFDLINDLAGVMRCMPIWSAGGITLAQDKPTDSTYLFNLSNVTEEGFSYSGSSLKTRHSVVVVSYLNLDSREIDYETVEDSTAKSKLGTVVKQVKAFATTSRGQAQRLGKAILFDEANANEIVSFSTSIDAGVLVRPGAVISISDPVRSGYRRAGRISSYNASTKQITVDDVKDLSTYSGSSQKCVVQLPDGSLEERDVQGLVNGVITLSSALSQSPNVGSQWTLKSSSLEPQLFRVLSVDEVDGINYKISALAYQPGKYQNIEQGISLPARNVSLLNAPVDAPSNLTFVEKTVTINAVAISRLFITWVPVTGVNQYLFQYRFNNGNWVSTVVFRPDFTIDNSQEGKYEFIIHSYNAALELSPTAYQEVHNAKGKTDVPSDVANLTAEPVGLNLLRLRWDRSVDADVVHGGRVYVRHSNKTDGTGTFAGSVDLVSALAGNTTEAVVPALDGEYILKFQDDGGRYSDGETSLIIDLPDVGQELIATTVREDLLSTPYSGSKTNVTYDSSLGGLRLTAPGTNSTGIYVFNSILDLGGTFTLTLRRKIQSIGYYIGDEFDNRTDNIDTWTDFDGTVANDTDCQVYVRTSTDGTNYGSYNVFANGEFKARYFQFKAALAVTDTAQNLNVQQLGYTAVLPSRTEQSTTTIVSGSGSKNVVFSKPFFVGTSSLGGANSYLPSVGITAQSMQSGDFFELTNVSATGFTIHFKNGSSSIDRNFSYQAVGFGKGV